MKFNENLMMLRKKNGLSQEELGYKIGVSRQTVSKWELGQTTPEMDKLIELSALFEVSIDYLVGKEKAEAEKTAIQSDTHTDIPKSRFHYEYKSKRTVKGIPLVHINFGMGLYCAKGIIAIGNVAIGLLSFGLVSAGVLAFGVLAAGLLSFGAFAVGLATFGAIAAGMFAFGGVAMGFMAFGGCAVGQYAIGGYAAASDIAFGGVAHGGDFAVGKQYASGTNAYYGQDIRLDLIFGEIWEKAPDTPEFIKNIFDFAAKTVTFNVN